MPLCFQSRPTLVAYVTCGDPDLATTREIVLAAVEAGAGVIELGVPFSDPLADGPVIQRASERALRALGALGVEPRGVLVAPLRIAFLVPRESAKECVRRLHAEFVERS